MFEREQGNSGIEAKKAWKASWDVRGRPPCRHEIAHESKRPSAFSEHISEEESQRFATFAIDPPANPHFSDPEIERFATFRSIDNSHFSGVGFSRSSLTFEANKSALLNRFSDTMASSRQETRWSFYHRASFCSRNESTNRSKPLKSAIQHRQISRHMTSNLSNF
jgi:hypothetical protein